MKKQAQKSKLLSLLFLLICLLVSSAMLHAQQYEHVVIIGVDGMSPDGIQNANTPNMDQMMKQGAHTFHARGVLPTKSSPNWASMLMGAGPEQHGVTSNSWEPYKRTLPPIAESRDNLFPTIFWQIYKDNPETEIGAIYHWRGIGRLIETKAVDRDARYPDSPQTTQAAAQYIIEKQPKFLFVHLDEVDHVGHAAGHGSKAYYESVSEADEWIGQIVNAVEKAGIADKTLIIVSADHGGVGKGHGGESLAEIEIPIILSGKGVKEHYKITQPAYIYDIAATVAWALGVEAHEAWIGRPIRTAFQDSNRSDALSKK